MLDAGFSPAELGMDPVDAAQAYRMALMAQNKSKGAGSSSSAVDHIGLSPPSRQPTK